MNFPQEYLEVLKCCKEKGVPLGDRLILLENKAGATNPLNSLPQQDPAHKQQRGAKK